ncbi:hypothetical protein BG015_011039 [Linnemannia schmuckeri]|uniref:Uncharacterized protein n=1 Tax=Linnemannia schmuckeri TaxID=64567 RepID=A0A9P5V8N9_9FUNG|nr:hypothetical protein BG015_011039 [Linnemannia schmuckeri]
MTGEDPPLASVSATAMNNSSTARTEWNADAGVDEDDQTAGRGEAEGQRTSRRESKDNQSEQRNCDTTLLKRSLELNQIWECMRLASQELMDACSRADFDAVLKVLDSTLVKPRLSLEAAAAQEAASAAAAAAAADREGGDDEVEYLTRPLGQGIDRHGKRRQSSLDPIQSRHDSIGTGSEARFLDDDLTMTTAAMIAQEMSGAGVGTSSHRPSAASLPSRDRTLESSNEVPLVIHRSSLFRPRSRVSSDGGCTASDSNDDDRSQSQQHPTLDTLSGSYNHTSTNTNYDDVDPPPHMPWIDGRALTSALLAVCFRRDGYESPEAELDEELRAVPIVRELLKYDCMLTAQSLGQAVLGVAYSRSAGSLKRAREQRLLWHWQRLQPYRRQDRSVGGSSSHSRRDSISQGVTGSDTSAAAATATASGPLGAGDVGGQGVGLTESVMDLLLERIGPREWLKLIKCYLQRQEFDDLAVVLERCPFKGPQLETRNKEQQQQQDKNQQYPYSGPVGSSLGHSGAGGGYSTTATRGGGGGGSLLSPQQGEYDRQRAREMICREAGICGVGTRIGHFNSRGIGQASYNVSSTLYEASRVLFTGSGTRFSHSYMLPRGGFRGIGGNSSGHTGSPANSTASQVAGTTESLHAVDDQEVPVSHLATAGVAEASQLNQTPTIPGHQQQQQQQGGSPQNQDHRPSQFQTMHHQVNDNRDNDNTGEHSDDSDDSDNELYGDEEDDPESNIEQFESHDSNFAFGGVGSSTTSSSRPGPGIVGIAIQVQAPEHILNALLKMGFRFFSICDLSISDSRHPLALQFRQQEKMNRQLIEFCMVPDLERLGDGGVGAGIGAEGSGDGKGRKKGKGKNKGRKFDRRDESRYGEADREAHALVVQAFLYPAASSPTRGWSSIPALPTMVSSISQRISTVDEGYLAPLLPSSPTPAADVVLPLSAPPSPLATTTPQPTPAPTTTIAGTSMLTPSNRLQFVLPPVQLGDSFESISTIVKFVNQQNPDLDVSSSSLTALTTPTTPTAAINDFNNGSPSQSTLTQGQCRQSGFATSMPLPIRTSMVEKRLSAESTFFSVHNNTPNSSSAGYHLPHSPNSSNSLAFAASHFANQHRMLLETVRRRVRETLCSDYMDLMTVGICLYQACYHKKETLLSVLLEHRLLIAQDALTGAVQVAASVGWKRGLELLLVQCGDMEAEIEPVVTTTTEYVHLGTSMKWDHATAFQVFPNGRREPSSAGSGGRSSIPDSLGARRGARVAAAGGLEGLTTRGLRRHRSDGSRLNQSGEGFFGGGAGGPSYTGGDATDRPVAMNRRASFESSHSPIFQSGVFSTSPTSEGPPVPVQSSLFEPVIPSARTSSLRSKLSSLIPNLAIASGSTIELSQKPAPKNKQQLPTQQQSNPTSALLTKTTIHRPDQPSAILMLSTSGLWSLPTVMMQRKSRNAVVALMAACTRNDPALVTWLIETFADIKVVHIMQALMIACDRGLLRVVKALLGGPLVAYQGIVGDGSESGGGKKKTLLGKKRKDALGTPTATAGSSRSLFRRWLAFQYQQILNMTQQPDPTSFSSTTKPTVGSGVAEQANEKHEEAPSIVTASRTDPEGDSSVLPRFDSFPFVFLMESSPLFRHYYQILNTLSSCQFMLKRSGVHPVGGIRTTAGSPATSSGTQQQQQQPSAPEQNGDSNSAAGNNAARSSSSAHTATAAASTATTLPPVIPPQRRASTSVSTSYPSSPPQPPTVRPQLSPNPRQAQHTPQETKREIIRLMLAPILETLGPISVRKALDKLPKDSWWPLDHDVRMMVDQEARKDMVAIVVAMKKRQKKKQEKELELRVLRAMRKRTEAKDADDDEEEMSSGGEGVGGVREQHVRHARRGSSRAAVDLQQLSEQKRKERRRKGKDKKDAAKQREEEEVTKASVSDRWHRASRPFRLVRKWVVERKKKSAAKDRLVLPQPEDEESEEDRQSGGSGQGTQKMRPFDLTSTQPGLTVIH